MSKQLPICSNVSDEEKLLKVVEEAHKRIEKQPCITLKYDVREQGPFPYSPNHFKFQVILKNPYKTMVKEEYISMT